MADTLRLRVVLDLAERVVNPMKRIKSGSSDAAKAIQATKDRLKELNQQQAMVNQFGPMKRELADTAAKLSTAQAKVADLSKAYGQAGPPTRAMARELASAKKAATALATAHDGQQVKLQQLRDRLNAAGISTRELSTHSRRLKADIGAANASIDAQTSKLKAASEQHKKLQALNAQHAKAMLHTGMVGGVGMAMQAGGRRGVEIGMMPVSRFAEHEDAMLGIARQVAGARDEAGKLTGVYRQAEREVRDLSQDIPLVTTDIAKMMTAAARMEVPTGELKEFTRLASEMATSFDAVPDQITESMGKVAKNYRIPLVEIRGLADAINYLDDNAISKGADIIDFLNRTSGVVSTVAMSARDAAALGSTLLTLGERPEAASTAVNAIVQKMAAATKGTKKFHAAMKEIGLSPDAVQTGMSKDATATLDKVVSAIRALPQEKRIGVMVELIGLEHSDTMAKLVDKPDELARQRNLANGIQSQGSMAREAAARNAVLSAQWQMARNRAFNLAAVVGESLAPALHDLMRTVGPIVTRTADWVQAHPTLVGWTMKLALGVAVLITAMGMLLVPAALLVGKLLLMRFLWMRLGMAFGVAGMGSKVAAAGLGLLARAASGAWAVLAWLARGLMALGGFMMANPIVLALTLVASAAFLLWRNWDGVKGGLLAIWQQLSDAAARWWGSTTAGAQALWADLVALKDRFFSVGSDMIGGLINGITSRWGALKSSVVETADAVSGWFKERLGINSPSRVFMQYGSWISDGAALGMLGGQGAVRSAALAMAAAAAGAMPLAAQAGALAIDNRPAMPLKADLGALAIDTRPALTTGMQGRMGGGAAQAPVYNITIHAAPGMDARDLAKAVSAELDRRDRAGRSRVLSSLSDID